MLLSFLNYNSYCGIMIDVIFGIVLMVLLLYVWFYTKRKLLKNYVYDPFGFSYVIVTMLKCKECGTNGVRLFKRGDYIFGVSKKCPKCKKGDFVIVSIIWERPKTKEELKYEKLDEKWK